MADSERLRERIRYETEVVKLMTLVTVAIGGGSSSLLLGLGVTTTTWFRISVGVVGFIRGRIAPRGAARAQGPRSAARSVPLSGCAAISRRPLEAASAESEGP